MSSDEFAAALKLIVKRLDGQDDEAETPPPGSDSAGDSAAIPPTAVLDSAPQPALSEPVWTGLSESGSDEPQSASPLAGGTGAFADATRDTESTDGTPSAGATTAADLWPATSEFPDEATQSTEAPAPPEDPLFAEAPIRYADPLFSDSPEPRPGTDPLFTESPPGSGGDEDPLNTQSPADQPVAEDPAFQDQAAADPLFSPAPEPAEPIREPLFADTSASEDPLFAAPSTPPPAKEPLFVDSSTSEDPLFAAPPTPSTAKEPLFVETPAQSDAEPLFAEKPAQPEPDTFTAEIPTAPSPAATDHEPTADDPLAGLRNRQDAPTIGPAMPDPEPSQDKADTTVPTEPEPPTADTPMESDQAADSADPASSLDYPEPAGQPGDTTPSDATGGLGGAPNDPFASAARPAFEDERSNALFGDSPSLAEQHAPGSSLGPIGAESEDFDKESPSQRNDDERSGQKIGDADLTAIRDLGEETDSAVELDQILPPLDPEADSLEKAAIPPRPRRRLRVGAAAFWLLILAIFGGIGYWGFQTRDQTVALSTWAQARYELPTGQLSALLGIGPDSPGPVSEPETTVEPNAPTQDLAALPPAPEPAPPQPAALPEPAPPPAAVERPAPVASPPPASTGSQPVTVAATPPPRLPDHLAPLPSDASPQIRSLADRALSGDPLAQHDLANQYAVGETVAQSNSYAAHWYRLASDAGIANAQYNLGVLTARGLGVRKELDTAFQLFLTAAEAGHADAQTAVGLAYMYGSGVQQDRLQAASWFQAASTNGRPRGAFHLGQLFELGLDEAPDLAAAAGWYRIAADAGFVEGKEALERLTAAVRPTPAPTPAPSTAAAPDTTPPPVPPSTEPASAAPSELVREVQQMLNALGYDAGPEDGMNGGKTRLAIMAFQRSQGLYVTGEANRGTHELLRVVSGL